MIDYEIDKNCDAYNGVGGDDVYKNGDNLKSMYGSITTDFIGNQTSSPHRSIVQADGDGSSAQFGRNFNIDYLVAEVDDFILWSIGMELAR